MEDDRNSQPSNNAFLGPVTVKEIKKMLSFKKPPEFIGRRASISIDEPSRRIYGNSPTTDYLVKKHLFDNGSDELSVSFTSEYFTPNETLRNEISTNACSTPNANRSFQVIDKNNKDFIEKVSKALNLDNSIPSAYTSAAECSGFKCHDGTKSSKSSLNFSAKDIQKSLCLGTESEIILVSDDESDNEDSNRSLPENLTQSDVSDDADEDIQNSTSSEIYIISDGDGSYEIQREIKIEDKEQLSQLNLHIDEESLPISNTKNESFHIAYQEQSNHAALDQQKSSEKAGSVAQLIQPTENLNLEKLEDEPDVYLNKNSIEIVDVIEFERNEEKLTDDAVINLDAHSDSAINLVFEQNVPDNENDLNSTSNHDHHSTSEELSELSSSSCYEFNDTLEEMERALRDGLDYTMSEELNNSNDDTGKMSVEAVRSDYKCESTNLVETKIPKPIRNINSQSKLQKFSPIKINDKPDFDFKIPSKPLCINRSKTPDFKNVLSPVAVYIKNSPRVPQIQHVSATPLKGALFSKYPVSKTTCNKENLEQTLPTRIYKPAKCIVTPKEKELKLPGNIQKHLPNIPDVIKHTGRIGKKQTDSSSVEAKLLAEDLTVDYTNGVLNSSESAHDISLLTTKKTYIK